MQKTHSLKYQHCLCSCFCCESIPFTQKRGRKQEQLRAGLLLFLQKWSNIGKICQQHESTSRKNISRKFEKHLKFKFMIDIPDCTCGRWTSCLCGRWASALWPETNRDSFTWSVIVTEDRRILKSLLIKSRSCPGQSFEEDRGCSLSPYRYSVYFSLIVSIFLLPVCAETVGKSEKIAVELRIEVWQSCRKNLELFLSHFHTLNIRKRVESVRETAKRKRP